MSSQSIIESEPILLPSNNRFVVFPIQYPDIWEMFQKQRKAIWSESEIDLVSDLKHWDNLNENEKFFIKRVLAFFAASDGIVMENLGTRFMEEVQIPEARCFYASQIYIETIHSIMYAQLLDTYVSNIQEKEMLFKSIETIPTISKKAQWALKWMNSNEDFATRLVAFICVEGIHFSGSFCCIFWLKERGILPGLTKSNDFISRDEGLHCDFGVLLYNHLKNKLTTEKVHQIVREALEIEKEFIVDSIPCHMIGMNAKLMSEYLDFVANRVVLQLGYESLFKEKLQNPFPFMDRICFDSKDNFFDGRVTSYQMSIEKSKEDEIESLAFNCYF
jgi:ribonucleotide reductase beta subunit family protein with ferritin-like domain